MNKSPSGNTDTTVTGALTSFGASVLVAVTALILNHRGFSAINARMLSLESRVDSRFNLALLKDKAGV